MAVSMVGSVLRQTTFRCLRNKYVCFPSRTYASGSGEQKHYDLLVIGGGSGGLACSKEAADIGKKAALLDFVTPSPQGTRWGLGGTCVNVGCIPKKLMHQASQLGGAVVDAGKYGWNIPENLQHDWQKLCEGVQGHIHSLNWGFRLQLKNKVHCQSSLFSPSANMIPFEKDVDYYNAKGRLIDDHTVCATDHAGKETIITADNIVIATGMRPKYPVEIPGAMEHSISSDDIFWQLKPPGKTLVVGASYVALECAGFLAGLGYDTSVMVRSIPLRGFDQQMAQLVLEGLEDHGTRVISESVPTKIEKVGEQLKVEWTSKEGTGQETFDTVLMAVGRVPETSQLGLRDIGVELDKGGFVVGGHSDDHERTSVPNVYAVGDVLKDRPELTPVAIRAGRLLARRLFGGATEQMDYDKVPTTVFTPVEYSCVGLSEEVALEKYGEDNIEVYHGFYTPLEYTVPERSAKQCYVKLITEREEPQAVYGIHYMGPSAGEVMQGFAVALRCGVTRDKLLTTVGIHPTSAETVMALHITKRSGLDPTITGC